MKLYYIDYHNYFPSTIAFTWDEIDYYTISCTYTFENQIKFQMYKMDTNYKHYLVSLTENNYNILLSNVAAREVYKCLSDYMNNLYINKKLRYIGIKYYRNMGLRIIDNRVLKDMSYIMNHVPLKANQYFMNMTSVEQSNFLQLACNPNTAELALNILHI